MLLISNKINQSVEEKINSNDKNIVITTEEFNAQVDNSQVLMDVSKVSYSHTDVINYKISSDSYELILQKGKWGFSANVEILEDSDLFPRIFVDIPLDEDEEIKVGVKTTALSYLLDTQQAQNMSKAFAVAANNVEWIKEVMNNLEVLEEI